MVGVGFRVLKILAYWLLMESSWVVMEDRDCERVAIDLVSEAAQPSAFAHGAYSSPLPLQLQHIAKKIETYPDIVIQVLLRSITSLL